MAERLPGCFQPFLTWLTARPAPGESPRERSAVAYVYEALAFTIGGVVVGVLATMLANPLAWVPAMLVSWLLTTCGLGLFQVVVFHHASHGTVFAARATNRQVGRLISAILLFKHFDAYQKEHMLHHSANKLLTEHDEFSEFVLGMCRLEAGLSKSVLWRRVLADVVLSPSFHLRFLTRRMRAALQSSDPWHNAVGAGAWVGMALAAASLGGVEAWVLAWVIPCTVLLQVATVARILCEHRFPEERLISARGREFVCEATAGVFPGSAPPAATLGSARGWTLWALWWADMLSVQLVVRLFVLVGDAPCHDFHHRRPATRKWTSYIYARQSDVDAGCPGYPVNYYENWGLFRALDDGLATLARTPPRALRATGRDRAPRPRRASLASEGFQSACAAALLGTAARRTRLP